MRTYHHEVPGPFAVVLQILAGTAVGVLIAAIYLVLKPVQSQRPGAADSKAEEPMVERNIVTYTPGNAGHPSGQQWRIRERAFLEKAPTGVALSETDINRWIVTTYGSVDRRVKLESYGLEMEPEPPLVRLDGTEMEMAIVYRCTFSGAKKSIVAQARGGVALDGDMAVFTPSRVYLGSCPLPGKLGTMLIDRLELGYPAPENVAASWKAVKSAKIEESQLKLAFN